MMMLTNSEPVMTTSVAHTCKPPPEPPPKSQLRSIQESTQSPSSKFGLMFESFIMGPKKIKHATLNAPVINVYNNSKRSNWPTFKTQSHKAPRGRAPNRPKHHGATTEVESRPPAQTWSPSHWPLLHTSAMESN